MKKKNPTLDVFVVSTVSGLLAEVETFLLTGHKGPDGNAVFFTHHTLRRGLIDLTKNIFFSKIYFFLD